MHIIVDGYNFVRCTPLVAAERAGLEAGRDAVCQWLAGLRRARGHDIVVVFDGDLASAIPPLPGKFGGVHVQFAPSADAAIAAQARSGCLVVTSDRAVQRAVERAGAVACNSEAFWRQAEPLLGPGTADVTPATGEAAAADEADAGHESFDLDDDWTKALDDPRLWALAEEGGGGQKGGQRQTKRGRRLSKRESRLRTLLERL